MTKEVMIEAMARAICGACHDGQLCLYFQDGAVAVGNDGIKELAIAALAALMPMLREEITEKLKDLPCIMESGQPSIAISRKEAIAIVKAVLGDSHE